MENYSLVSVSDSSGLVKLQESCIISVSKVSGLVSGRYIDPSALCVFDWQRLRQREHCLQHSHCRVRMHELPSRLSKMKVYWIVCLNLVKISFKLQSDGSKVPDTWLQATMMESDRVFVPFHEGEADFLMTLIFQTPLSDGNYEPSRKRRLTICFSINSLEMWLYSSTLLKGRKFVLATWFLSTAFVLMALGEANSGE